MVSVGTIRKVITGEIFVAPDFKLWQERKDQAVMVNTEGEKRSIIRSEL
jgi:hypothetical protein